MYYPGMDSNTRRSVALNRKLLRSKSARDLSVIFKHEITDFNHVNLVTFLKRYLLLSNGSASHRLISQCLRQTTIKFKAAKEAGNLQARHVSSMLWNVQLIVSKNSEFDLKNENEAIEALLNLVQPAFSDSNTQEISVTLWSLAKIYPLGVRNSLKRDRSGRQILSVEEYSKLIATCEALFVSACKRHPSRLSCQSISNTVWAIAKLRKATSAHTLGSKLRRNSSLVSKIITSTISSFREHELDNLLWALRTIQCWLGVEFSKALLAYLHKVDLTSHYFINLLGYFAKSKESLDVRIDLTKFIQKRLKFDFRKPLSAFEVKLLIESLTLLRDSIEEKQFKLFCKHCFHRFLKKRGQSNSAIINYLHFYAKQGFKCNSDMQKSIIEYVDEIENFCLSARDLAVLSWTLARIDFDICFLEVIATTFKKIERHCLNQIDEFNSQECSKILYAFRRVGLEMTEFLQNTQKMRKSRYKFLRIQEDGHCKQIKLAIWHALAGGRGRDFSNREEIGTTKSTGIAVWEASVLFAEWLVKYVYISELSMPKHASIELDKNSLIIEVGAGTGLPSLAIYKALGKKIGILCTDGDEDTLSNLKTNCARVKTCNNNIYCKSLKWGTKLSPEIKTIVTRHSGRKLILGAGIVYGSKKAKPVWKQLLKTLRDLCQEGDIILLAHGQGAAPGVLSSSGYFFRKAARYFSITTMEKNLETGFVLHKLLPLRIHI